MPVLVGNIDVVEAGTAAIVQFGSFCRKAIAAVYGFDKADAGIERYRKIVAVVAGKGKSTVGQREGDAAVDDAKAINHFFADRHLYPAEALLYIQYLYAQPLAEAVVRHHVLYNSSGGLCGHNDGLFALEERFSFF